MYGVYANLWGLFVREVLQSFERDWALRWIRGSIESYILGRTPLELIKGRIKKAVESYGVSPKDVSAIINSILVDPLINIPKELREERTKPLIEFIEDLGG